jgi:hypothetical protein
VNDWDAETVITPREDYRQYRQHTRRQRHTGTSDEAKGDQQQHRWRA